MPRFSVLSLIALLISQSSLASDYRVEWPEIVVSEVAAPVVIEWSGDSAADSSKTPDNTAILQGQRIDLTWVEGKAEIPLIVSKKGNADLQIGTFSESKLINPVPLWMSILPPLIAILLALVFREVLSALFTGIFFGTGVMGVYSEGWTGIFTGFFRVIDTYILHALNDSSRLSVILFTMIIGGLVALVSKNGGMKGVVAHMTKLANSARNAQLTTWLLGVLIFFDDYANTLVVGNTMRPLTDRWRISREKLSYLVDSTAAPVAAIAFVTTWIGAELGYIGDGLSQIADSGTQIAQGPYAIFLSSLQFSFYPVFTLVFMLMLIYMRKDFGAMHKAEIRARTTGGVSAVKEAEHLSNEEMSAYEPEEGTKINSMFAIIPVSLVIIGTITGLLITGYDPETWSDASLSFARKLSATIGNADSYKALLWSSLLSLTVAVGMTVLSRQLSLTNTMHAVVNGFKFMMHAILILALAWTLADITEVMHTAEFLQASLGSEVAPWLIPAFTFILAAAVSFSTGSSWGTMAILYPLILPLSWQVAMDGGYEHAEAMMIFYNTTACVLAGSVLGDHCSPISDTTILSSLATSCHHIDHVRTQMPYALIVGLISLCVGTIPGALGVPFWISFPSGFVVLFLVVRFFGKAVPEPEVGSIPE